MMVEVMVPVFYVHCSFSPSGDGCIVLLLKPNEMKQFAVVSADRFF